MKNHGILHRIAIAAGLLLGITATGVGAKANVNQPANVNNNRDQPADHLDQNSVQNNRTTLIDQPSRLNHKISSLEQKPQVQTDNGQINNDPDSRNQPEPSRQSARKINNRTDQLYNHIITAHLSRNPHTNSNSNGRISKTDPLKSRSYSMDAIGAHRVHHRRRNRRGITISHHRHHRNRMNNIIHDHYHRHHLYRNSIQSVSSRRVHHHHNWFRDGLSHRNLKARSWVSMHESSHRWYVLSYGHVCVGYFQLNPHYLGYRHGHIDLRPRHQVRVADRYVRGRYGNWVNAKRFWEAHRWY